MRAFVLSGGANYGAQQVGALEVLLEHGLQPDMVMGVSAGGLNAAWIAAHPTLEGVRELARIWREDAARYFPPVGPLNTVFRLIGGKDCLLPNDSLQQFIRQWALAENTFGEFTHPRLYTVAASLINGSLRVFGDDPNDRLLDGLMATAAMPPIYPPWEVDGVPYLDGGIISHLPLLAAAARGADEIIALHNGQGLAPSDEQIPRTMLSIGARAISLLVDRQARLEIEAVQRDPSIRCHLIHLCADDDPGLWNFARSAELMAAGRRLAEEYLSSD